MPAYILALLYKGWDTYLETYHNHSVTVSLKTQGLNAEESSELQTQINLFYEHKDLDAEEFSHRYDNIRLLMEYLLLGLVDLSTDHITAYCEQCRKCVEKYS